MVQDGNIETCRLRNGLWYGKYSMPFIHGGEELIPYIFKTFRKAELESSS
jgi:hypothetical protein